LAKTAAIGRAAIDGRDEADASRRIVEERRAAIAAVVRRGEGGETMREEAKMSRVNFRGRPGENQLLNGSKEAKKEELTEECRR
jgi:hypothetical protein